MGELPGIVKLKSTMSTKKPRLLVVRREDPENSALRPLPDDRVFDLQLARTSAAALALLDERPVDLVLLDLPAEDSSATELLLALSKGAAGTVSVMVIDTPDERTLRGDATAPRADGYLTRPLTAKSLGYELERVLSHRNLRIEAEQLRRQMREQTAGGPSTLLGTSQAMQQVYQTVLYAASTNAPWLITGERGTGKRALARLVHSSSRRAEQPLRWFRTTGDEDEAAFGRLFGEGGTLAAAEGGTLVVEHVAALAPTLQLGLLHVLEHQEVVDEVGRARAAHVRILATETRDPLREVQAGRLREDLYERLRTVHVTLPPLRERGADVLLLAEHFLHRFAEENQRLVSAFSPRARAKLAAHGWGGNVRALSQVVESAVVLSQGAVLEASDLGFEPEVSAPDEPRVPGSTMADIEKHAILQTLDSVAGSTARAAEILDVSVRTIQYRLHEYGLSSKRKESRPPRA